MIRPGRGDGAGAARDAVRLAVGTLTAVPVPAPVTVDRRRAGLAMLLAPAVGLLVPGAAAAVVAALAGRLGLSTLPAAVLAIGTVALADRGLHLDGLADTADGLAASYRRERSLEVMRSGSVGPAGAVALVLVLGVQISALAEALAGTGPLAVAVAVMAGRSALPLACVRGVPAARPEGLGATVAGSVPRWQAAAALALTCVVGAALAAGAAALAWAPGATDGIGAAIRAAGAVLAAWLVAAVVVRRACTRFGGVTGDVLGAVVELGTAAALVVLALGS